MPNQLHLQNSRTGPDRLYEHYAPSHMKTGVTERWKEQNAIKHSVYQTHAVPCPHWDVLVQGGDGKAAAPSSARVNLPFHVPLDVIPLSAQEAQAGLILYLPSPAAVQRLDYRIQNVERSQQIQRKTQWRTTS